MPGPPTSRRCRFPRDRPWPALSLLITSRTGQSTRSRGGARPSMGRGTPAARLPVQVNQRGGASDFRIGRVLMGRCTTDSDGEGGVPTGREEGRGTVPSRVEAAGGFEPPSGGFADLCLAAWLRRRSPKADATIPESPARDKTISGRSGNLPAPLRIDGGRVKPREFPFHLERLPGILGTLLTQRRRRRSGEVQVIRLAERPRAPELTRQPSPGPGPRPWPGRGPHRPPGSGPRPSPRDRGRPPPPGKRLSAPGSGPDGTRGGV